MLRPDFNNESAVFKKHVAKCLRCRSVEGAFPAKYCPEAMALNARAVPFVARVLLLGDDSGKMATDGVVRMDGEPMSLWEQAFCRTHGFFVEEAKDGGYVHEFHTHPVSPCIQTRVATPVELHLWGTYSKVASKLVPGYPQYEAWFIHLIK